jgi:hypothetical protein
VPCRRPPPRPPSPSRPARPRGRPTSRPSRRPSARRETRPTRPTRPRAAPPAAPPRPARFCPECGERRVDADDYRLRTFAAHAADQLFNLDGTLWRTLRALAARPGLLTADYVAGRRARRTRPLQLFLLVNVAFFVVTGALGTFRFRLAQYSRGAVGTYAFRDTARVRALVALKARRAGIPAAEVERRFDASSAAQQSIWLALAPVLGGALALLYARRRLPYVRHLVFAVHLLAFMLLALCAALLALAALGAGGGAAARLLAAGAPGAGRAVAAAVRAVRDESVWAPAVLVWIAAYAVLALRRVYGDRWAPAALRAVALALLLMAFTNVYRDLLFAITLASV